MKTLTPILTPPLPDTVCTSVVSDKGITIPLLLDLPHGGKIYPHDFKFGCSKKSLELCEEGHLDELLFPPVLEAGGVGIKALFPRTYVDPNRAVNDIDQALLETPWLEPTLPQGRATQGFGIVMRHIRQGEPIYSAPLSHAEIRHRIDHYYLFYHNMLNGLSQQIHEEFGAVYHLNFHSMHSPVLKNNFPYTQPDFILGDLDGRSCGLNFRQHIAEALKDLGYRVAINQLYKGAEIVNRYGQPAWGRHCLQIEINRSLFENEETGEKLPKYRRLEADLRTLVSSVKDFIKI